MTNLLNIEINHRPELNPIIACPLHNFASINHISLVSTPNCNPFEVLHSDFLSFKTIGGLLQETHGKSSQFYVKDDITVLPRISNQDLLRIFLFP